MISSSASTNPQRIVRSKGYSMQDGCYTKATDPMLVEEIFVLS